MANNVKLSIASFLSLFLFSLIFTSCDGEQKKAYSINPILNPYRIAPLTAVLNITSDEPCNGQIKVLATCYFVKKEGCSGDTLNSIVASIK